MKPFEIPAFALAELKAAAEKKFLRRQYPATLKGEWDESIVPPSEDESMIELPHDA